MKNILTRISARKISVLYRYIATYSLMRIIPLMLLGLFLLNMAIQQINDRYIDLNRTELAQAGRLIDDEISILPQIMSHAVNAYSGVQNVFQPYYWKQGKYNYVDTVWQLEKIKRYNYLLEDCILVYRDENMLFTSSARAEARDYLTNAYQINGLIEYTEAIMSADSISMSDAAIMDHSINKQYNALVYVYPFKLSKITSYNMAMVFVISEQKFRERISQILGVKNYTVVLYVNGNHVFEAGNSTGIPRQQIDAFYAGDDDYMQINVDSHEMSAFKLHSTKFGMDYVLEVPWEKPVEQISGFRKLFFGIILTTLLLGLLLVLLFSYYNYKPLKKTLDSLKKQHLLTSESSNDEYIQLDQAIRNTVTNAKALEAHFNAQSQQFTMEILSALLTGAIHYENLDQAICITPTIPGPYYCVLTIHSVAGPGDYGDLAALAATASSVSFSLHKVVPLVITRFQCVAVIVNLDSEYCNESLLEQTELLSTQLSKKSTAYIGISQICANIDSLSHCMTEALLAMYDIMDSNEVGYRHYSTSLDNITQLTLLPDESVFSLKQSIKRGDSAQAISDMGRIMAAIDIRRNPIVRQILYYDIANIILKVINELRLNSTAFEVDFLQLFQNIANFQRNIKVIIADICGMVKWQKDENDVDPFTPIMQYIDEHYLEYDLSLEKLSSMHSISVASLSKMFKSRMGIGFKEYLIDKRISAAKHMLCSSKLTVGEIAAAIGYTSENYFIIIFKRLENMTPAMYRKRYEDVRVT